MGRRRPDGLLRRGRSAENEPRGGSRDVKPATGSFEIGCELLLQLLVYLISCSDGQACAHIREGRGVPRIAMAGLETRRRRKEPLLRRRAPLCAIIVGRTRVPSRPSVNRPIRNRRARCPNGLTSTLPLSCVLES